MERSMPLTRGSMPCQAGTSGKHQVLVKIKERSEGEDLAREILLEFSWERLAKAR